jgi:glycosyltransferase involved in cell wall biosynthesis
MKVAINLMGLPSVRQGGAGLYSEVLIRALAEQPGTTLRVLCQGPVAEELADLAGTAEITVAEEPGESRVRKALRLAASLQNPMRYGLPDGRTSPVFSGCDVVHYPLSFMSGPLHELPTVVTCVDLQHLAFPSFFKRSDRLQRRVRWHRSMAVAGRVIAISHDTKRALIDRLGVEENRVDVVHLACHERFFDEDPVPDPGFGRFVFYPASPLPAKNHDLLLRGFGLVAAEDPGLRLVLSGPVLHDWEPVRRSVMAARLADRVDLLGHVSLSRMKALYAHAQAMIFPSRFEGFGLPVLEAMASGCAVAASRLPSIVEIADGEAHLFDPGSEHAIADAIRWATSLDPSERRRITAAGRQRALGFRPAEMARRTIDAYRVVAYGSR